MMIKECFYFCRYYLILLISYITMVVLSYLGCAVVSGLCCRIWVVLSYLGSAVYYWAFNPSGWTMAQRMDIFGNIMGQVLLGILVSMPIVSVVGFLIYKMFLSE